MKIILIVVILILILIKSTFMKSNDKYNKAYTLGTFYLNSIDPDTIKKPAVMFDIDDTILMVNEKTGKLTINKPMLKLLNECIKRGYLIIIITARDSVYTKETIEDLNHNSINYSYLYCRKNPKDNYELFKSDIKKYLLDTFGIHIVMSVGDNLIDIIGEYSGYGIKLPNKTNKKLYHINFNRQLEEVI